MKKLLLAGVLILATVACSGMPDGGSEGSSSSRLVIVQTGEYPNPFSLNHMNESIDQVVQNVISGFRMPSADDILTFQAGVVDNATNQLKDGPVDFGCIRLFC